MERAPDALQPPPWSGGSAIGLERTRRTFNDNINKLMDSMATTPFPAWSSLKSWCTALYDSIVPPDVKTILDRQLQGHTGSIPPILRIHLPPKLEWIPWELMHDGAEYLGLRFQVTRLPIVSTGPDTYANGPHVVHRVYSFLGENVFDLPSSKPKPDAGPMEPRSCAQVSEVEFVQGPAAGVSGG